eukprot:Em0005g774a
MASVNSQILPSASGALLSRMLLVAICFWTLTCTALSKDVVYKDYSGVISASLSEGAAAKEAETRKINDPKCLELGWVYSIPKLSLYTVCRHIHIGSDFILWLLTSPLMSDQPVGMAKFRKDYVKVKLNSHMLSSKNIKYCQMEMGALGTHLAGTQSSPEVPELHWLLVDIGPQHFGRVPVQHLLV